MSIQLGDSFSGTISADAFRGTLNASDLTQGTIPAARFPTSGINATAIGDGSVNNTEFQALSSVTSDIQTQLNNRVVVNTAFATLTSTGDLTIADRMTHSGDVDTAIRFPSNDTVSVDTAGTEKLRITSAGNVGIVTTNPQNRLSVRDGDIALIAGENLADAGRSIRFFANAQDDTTNNYAEIKGGAINAGTSPQQGYLRFNTSGVERMRVSSTGNVGIGTAAPSQRLTVSGNISASGDLFADKLTVTGNSSFGQAISADSTIRRLTETFDVNKLPVTPNAQIAYNLASFRYNTGNFTGAIVFTAPTSLATIMHWMEIDGYLYENTGPFKCIIQGYKTSIWNTTGLYKQLLSEKDIPMYWGVAPNGNSCLVLSADTLLDYPQIHITKAMFSHTNGGQLPYSEGWSVTAVNTLNGFTGLSAIPTVTKFKDLTVTGSGVVEVNSPNAALRITQRGSGNALVVEDSTTPDTTPFVITSAGNVGIGTSTPNRTLTVSGNISATSGIAIGTVTGSGVVSIGNNCGLTMESTNGFTSNLSGLNIFKWTDNNLYVDNYDKDIVVRGPSAATRIRITEAGNVGIGITSPQYTLDVAGTIRAQATAGSGDCLIIGNDTRLVDINTANICGLYGQSNSDRAGIKLGSSGPTLYGSETGNLGIGTTAPATRLDVNGTVTATAFAGPITGNLTGTASAVADGAVSTAKIVDGNVTTAKLATATQQSLVPAGAVMPFAMNSAPDGWLAADGTAVSRSTYAALFAAIGTTHGAGNGTTTFNLPDLRGIFVRGSGSQTISGTAYSGTLGTKQNDLLKNHTHNHTDWTPNSSLVGVMGATNNIWQASSTNATRTTTNPNASLGGDETRPANIALLYCIKF